MDKTELKLTDLLKNGYVLYFKDKQVKAEKIPSFGSITLNYSDSAVTFLEKRETKK